MLPGSEQENEPGQGVRVVLLAPMKRPIDLDLGEVSTAAVHTDQASPEPCGALQIGGCRGNPRRTAVTPTRKIRKVISGKIHATSEPDHDSKVVDARRNG